MLDEGDEKIMALSVDKWNLYSYFDFLLLQGGQFGESEGGG